MKRIAFLTSNYLLAASGREAQLLPAGDFTGNGQRFLMNEATARRLIEQLSRQTNPMAFDYEHQTLLSKENGKEAPAAGWFKKLEWRPGQGLFAVEIDWTDKAKAYLANGEYKYVSPMFEFDKDSGEILSLMPPALTNYPAIDGMQAAALSKVTTSTPQETQMNELLKAMLTALGLKEDVTKEAAEAHIAALKTDAEKAKTLATEVATLKTATPDPAKFVPVSSVTELQTQLATLSAAVRSREVDEVVKQAVADGKIVPAMEGWAKELGAKDLAALKAFVKDAPGIAALSGTQTKGKAPEGGEGGEKSADEIAALASTYIADQAKLGRMVTSAQAVAHVTAKK